MLLYFVGGTIVLFIFFWLLTSVTEYFRSITAKAQIKEVYLEVTGNSITNIYLLVDKKYTTMSKFGFYDHHNFKLKKINLISEQVAYSCHLSRFVRGSIGDYVEVLFIDNDVVCVYNAAKERFYIIDNRTGKKIKVFNEIKNVKKILDKILHNKYKGKNVPENFQNIGDMPQFETVLAMYTARTDNSTASEEISKKKIGSIAVYYTCKPTMEVEDIIITVTMKNKRLFKKPISQLVPANFRLQDHRVFFGRAANQLFIFVYSDNSGIMSVCAYDLKTGEITLNPILIKG